MAASCTNEHGPRQGPRRGLRRRGRLALLLGCAAALAGCLPPSFVEDPLPELRLGQRIMRHDVPRHAVRSEGAFAAWLDQTIANSAENRPESLRIIALGGWDSDRRRLLTQAAVKLGVPMSSIRFDGRALYGIRHSALLIEKAFVQSVSCHPRDEAFTVFGSPRLFTPHLGCSTAANLGQIVADPRDLVQ